MAKKKDPRGGNWVRSGGADGDPSMENLDKFNREGAGVDESKVHAIQSGDPNEDLKALPKQKGSEFGS